MNDQTRESFVGSQNPVKTPAITKNINGYTVVLRFACQDNVQASATVRDLLVKSYASQLFTY
jgi:hypothetical protein